MQNPYRKRELEIYYSDLEKNKTYKYKILEFCKPKHKQIKNTHSKYIVYRCVALEDYDTLGLKNNDVFLMNFARYTFERVISIETNKAQWRQFPYTENTSCLLEFERVGNYLNVLSFVLLEI